MSKYNVYDDGQTKIQITGFLQQFIDLNEELKKLDLYQRIRILEFITGLRDLKEIKDGREANLVAEVLSCSLLGYTSPELNPEQWHLPDDTDSKSPRM